MSLLSYLLLMYKAHLNVCHTLVLKGRVECVREGTGQRPGLTPLVCKITLLIFLIYVAIQYLARGLDGIFLRGKNRLLNQVNPYG